LQLFALPHIVEKETPVRHAKPAETAKEAAAHGMSRIWGQGRLMSAQGRVATFFRKQHSADEVQPGGVYRHCTQKLTETAEVLALMTDEMGIPHVRFRVTIQAPYQRPFVDGPRTLNLRSFMERYREAVHA
jgi:hypothetical protein